MNSTANASCTGEDFSDAALPGQEWQQCRFVGCWFVDADLRGIRTHGCRFTDCDFTGADLGGSAHRGTALQTCTFRRTVLAGSVFESCSLLGSVLVECRLRPWTLREVDCTLAGLGHADLRETVLAGLRLREANLVEADLRGSDLSGADLSGARLLGARLDGADLRGAALDADALVQARLTGAWVDIETAIAFAAAHGLQVDLAADRPETPLSP